MCTGCIACQNEQKRKEKRGTRIAIGYSPMGQKRKELKKRKWPCGMHF